MADQPHTPTTDHMRDLYVRHADQLGIASEHVLHAEFDRFLAAAEQRGAERERKDIVGSLIDWDVIYGHEEGTPETREAHRIAAWIDDRADRITDQMEGDDE